MSLIISFSNFSRFKKTVESAIYTYYKNILIYFNITYSEIITIKNESNKSLPITDNNNLNQVHFISSEHTGSFIILRSHF
jgi:hypothetical protein